MGMRSKRGKDRKSTGWIRDTIITLYTQDQVIADWNAITPAERIKVVASWVPKEMKVESDTKISLIINGIRQATPIDGTIREALQAHEDNDEQPVDN